MDYKALVRGSGDVGSAVAHLLCTEGWKVAVHDEPEPAAPRRGMAFTDAIFEGMYILDGIEARLVEGAGELSDVALPRHVVALFTGELAEALGAFEPQVLVDARMRKRAKPEPQLGLAPLTVALGPNCEAGVTAHAVIETQWGGQLGEVLWEGRTRDLAGEPRNYGGHARDRFVYAPVEGRFSTGFLIADPVQQDQVVAHIDTTPLAAPLAGILRGLVRDGVTVTKGAKVVEVDPRADPTEVFGLGERPAQIARGVLRAIEEQPSWH